MKLKEFGVIGVGAIGFFALAFTGFEWVALGFLLICAIIFVALLVGKSKAYTLSIGTYRVITLAALLLIVGHALRFAVDYDRRNSQKEILLEIRSTIERGVAKSDIMKKGFYIYRSVEMGEHESIIDASKAIIGDRLLKNNVYLSDFDKSQIEWPTSNDDDADFFYSINEEEDLLTFIVVANIPPGANPEYENRNGNKGKMEMEFVVSKEGVTYEILN